MAKFLTAIPEADGGWIVFSGKKPVRGGNDLHEAADKKAGILVGVPVAKAPTFSIVVPTSDSSLFRQMAYAQIEKRGLSEGSMAATLFDYDVLEQGHGKTRLAVHVFDTPLPDDYILNQAAGYAPSPLVRQRLENGAVLWKEHRQLVIAIFRDGKLAHSQVLTCAPELNAVTAREINFLLLALEGDPAFEDSLPEKLVVVWGEDEETSAADREAFAGKVGLETAFALPTGAHRKAVPRPSLTPRPILAHRRRKKNAAWLALASVIIVAGYFLFGALKWKKAEAQAQKIEALKRKIAIVEPDVLEIQRIQERWAKMEPAFDLKWFPVVQLSRITQALPGTGVVIREYESRGRDIYIKGDARDVQLAFRLEEDLGKIDGFDHYQWTMPKPNMNSDNTASFRIEGKPKQASE